MEIPATGSATINVSIVPPSPPDTYLGVAHGMIRGVTVLADASPTPHLALAFVAAHVLECSLKAYLSRGGDDTTVRAPGLRHNLVALWALAHSQGLSVPPTPPGWVTQLGSVHGSPYYLRYSTGVHSFSLPMPEPMATELKLLLDLVQQSVR